MRWLTGWQGPSSEASFALSVFQLGRSARKGARCGRLWFLRWSGPLLWALFVLTSLMFREFARMRTVEFLSCVRAKSPGGLWRSGLVYSPKCSVNLVEPTFVEWHVEMFLDCSKSFMIMTMWSYLELTICTVKHLLLCSYCEWNMATTVHCKCHESYAIMRWARKKRVGCLITMPV